MFGRKRHPIVKQIHNVLLEKKFEGAYINKVYGEEYTLVVNLHLPEHKERADLEKILPNLQQEMGATAIKLGKVSGKNFELLFGMRELENFTFDESMLIADTLQLKFPSAYGEAILDFEDGASCHMLNGGVTRMGKTCFLLYLATSIYLQNKGNIKLYISSAKLKDYYPFEGVQNVTMERDVQGMEYMLGDIIDEYKKRDTLLYSPSFQKATDAKSVRKLYLDKYDLFQPIFVIIDEYARFAESKIVQQMVTEIVETAGFVNIHVIIASQRPDASTVLRPRIRANLLARMAFTTADRKNSEVILDREGAEKLGKIAGRGILNDGDSQVIQVPYLDAVECYKLLEPYRKDVSDEQESEGYVDNQTPSQIQSAFSEPDSFDSLLGEFQSNKRSKPGFAEDVFGWEDTTDTEGKG
jgi:hypothetical protein